MMQDEKNTFQIEFCVLVEVEMQDFFLYFFENYQFKSIRQQKISLELNIFFIYFLFFKTKLT